MNSQETQIAETYKSMITLSVEGFKFCALANGGAAVALLAFLGNVASKGASGPDMRAPMGAFLLGLVFCAIAVFFAYMTQFRLLRELFAGGQLAVRHPVLLWMSAAAYVLSIAAFSAGAVLAVIRF